MCNFISQNNENRLEEISQDPHHCINRARWRRRRSQLCINNVIMNHYERPPPYRTDTWCTYLNRLTIVNYNYNDNVNDNKKPNRIESQRYRQR